MRILGIDPGLATIGLGLIDATNSSKMQSLDWLTIETKPGPLPDRLKEIHTDLTAYIKENTPELVVIEKLYFATNARTAIDVAQARGVILLAVQEKGIPTIEPTPLQLKSAITSDGSADKRQIQDMLKILLHLDQPPTPDDAADALALAVYGCLSQKFDMTLAS
jgi:crossover junction endodeoxyribonuclease RuvC